MIILSDLDLGEHSEHMVNEYKCDKYMSDRD